MSERALPLLLDDIKISIEHILDFTKGLSFKEYESDLKTRYAVERSFTIIGEAVARVPDDFKKQHTQINWRQVKDFRNFLVHDYMGIEHSIVWEVIQVSLPGLLYEIALLINR
jgi:uncharacterized protein with HEPN domain